MRKQTPNKMSVSINHYPKDFISYTASRHVPDGPIPTEAGRANNRRRPISPDTLARAGFYYTGNANETMCLMCGLRYSEWQPGLNPMEIHTQLRPGCPFLKQTVLSHTSLQYSDQSAELVRKIQSKSTLLTSSGKSTAYHQILPGKLVTSNTKPTQHAPSVGKSTSRDEDTKPKHPGFSNCEARLSSFSGWTVSVGPRPHELAGAGFFFTGCNDCVRCYQCGGGLMNWKDGDDVKTEHALWFPGCPLTRDYENNKAKKTSASVMSPVSTLATSGNVTETQTQKNTTEIHSESAVTLNGIRHNGDDRTMSIDPELFTPEALAVMEMGYEPDVVLAAIETVKMAIGAVNVTKGAILETLFAQDDRQRPQTAGQTGLSVLIPQSQIPARHQPPVQNPAHVTRPHSPVQSSRQIEDKHIPKTEPETLAKENTELKTRSLCRVCLSNEACIVFLPCGHMITCRTCAPLHVKCCICRKRINATVRAYLP